MTACRCARNPSKRKTRHWKRAADNKRTDEGETVALTSTRAEELINAVRRGLGAPPLELDATGGEGTVSRIAGRSCRTQLVF
jgi:hypothetical protein